MGVLSGGGLFESLKKKDHMYVVSIRQDALPIAIEQTCCCNSARRKSIARLVNH